ncbi:hypothetical protein IJS64_03660 [bacterium]|nr:hypothetical protein [bacterium]
MLLDAELSVVSGIKVSSLACVDEKRAHPFCPESETDSVLANIHPEFSVATGSTAGACSLFVSKLTSGAFSKFSTTAGASDIGSVEDSGKIIEGIQDSSAFAPLLLSAEVSGATVSITGAAAGSSVLFSD